MGMGGDGGWGLLRGLMNRILSIARCSCWGVGYELSLN